MSITAIAEVPEPDEDPQGTFQGFPLKRFPVSLENAKKLHRDQPVKMNEHVRGFFTGYGKSYRYDPASESHVSVVGVDDVEWDPVCRHCGAKQ